MPWKFSRDEYRFGRSAFHVWNRGTGRQRIFLDDEDRRIFVDCLGRYLTPATRRDGSGRAYAYLGDGIRLLAFALLGNHFHLVVEQLRPGALEHFMRRVLISYVRAFNRRHGRKGSPFSGPYRRRALKTPGELRTAIAYVLDNHGSTCDCEFCSHAFLIERENAPTWFDPRRVLELFGDVSGYLEFRLTRAKMKRLTR